jgi:UDP-N-acetylglucosamine 3-dehydrogenase
MSSRLRAAIIGSGQIARLGHIPGYQKTGVEITAICDVNEVAAKQVSEAAGIPRYYTDWKKMLAEGGFEVVSICTPPFLHYEMAVGCAQKGFAVLVEKPMARSLDECDQMIAAAQKAGVLLMVSQNQRFMAAHQLAKEILVSSVLGVPYLVHAVFGHSGPEMWSPTQQWYFQPGRAGLGVMSDLGSHKIDLIRWLTGQEVSWISAFAATFEKNTTLEDTAVFSMQLSGGTLATIEVSWVFRPDWDNGLVVRCEHGSIRVPTEASEPVRVLRLDPHGRTVESTHLCHTDDPSGWFGAVSAFVTAVSKGLPSPASGSEGKAALTAILAAHQSVEEKRVIQIS